MRYSALALRVYDIVLNECTIVSCIRKAVFSDMESDERITIFQILTTLYCNSAMIDCDLDFHRIFQKFRYAAWISL